MCGCAVIGCYDVGCKYDATVLVNISLRHTLQYTTHHFTPHQNITYDSTLHYTTLHNTALQSITLHCIASQHITPCHATSRAIKPLSYFLANMLITLRRDLWRSFCLSRSGDSILREKRREGINKGRRERVEGGRK